VAPVVHLWILQLPTYFLIISFVCCLGVFILPWWAERFGQSEALASKLYLLILVSGFLGGRLFHILFEDWSYYVQHPLEMLYVWQGGFVFLGGVALALLASWYWLKKQGEDFLQWADLFAPWMSFGYAFGRVGCFFNGCCYGKECHLPWAVKFPAHMFVIEPFVSRHPTQIYAFLGAIFTFLMLAIWSVKRKEKWEAFKNTGFIFFAWLMLSGFFRFVIEFYRDDDRGPLYYGFSISSMLSVLMVGCGFWLWIWRRNALSS